MSRWSRECRLVIALGRRQAVVATDTEHARCLDLADGMGELSMDLPEDRVARLRDWLTAQVDLHGAPDGSWRLVCTNELSRTWSMEVPSGIRSRRELLDVARARCSAIFGSSARSWSIAADWRASGRIACWAIPGWLEQMGGDSRLPPGALIPQVLAALARDLPREGWIAVYLPQSVALVRMEKARVRQVCTFACEDGEDVQARVDIEMRRELRRNGSEEGLRPAWSMIDARRLHAESRTDAGLATSLALRSDACLPAWGRTYREHFLGAVSTPWQKMAASTLFLAAASGLVWVAADGARENSAAQLALTRMEAQRASAASRTMPASSPTLSITQRTRLNAAIRHLNTPWGKILDSLEANTPDGVRIVAVEANGDRPTVRLKVTGMDMETLLRYAAGLASLPAFERTDLVQQDADGASAAAYLTFDLALRPQAVEVAR